MRADEVRAIPVIGNAVRYPTAEYWLVSHGVYDAIADAQRNGRKSYDFITWVRHESHCRKNGCFAGEFTQCSCGAEAMSLGHKGTGEVIWVLRDKGYEVKEVCATCADPMPGWYVHVEW